MAMDLVSRLSVFLQIYNDFQSGVSTALPVIVKDLKGSEFEWIGSAYSLSATAFMLLSGGFAQVGLYRPARTKLILYASGIWEKSDNVSPTFLFRTRERSLWRIDQYEFSYCRPG